MARRKEAHGGGHGWFVTFADLMGLLVSFFVMLVAFSNQDAKQMEAVAGSMREAFGVQESRAIRALSRATGCRAERKSRTLPSSLPRIHPLRRRRTRRVPASRGPCAFALAAASLRQALGEMPELAEASKHIMLEDSKEGLNIEIVDQDGRAMFPDGARQPYERTRQLIQEIAGPLKAVPYRIAITGHTAGAEASPRPDYGAVESFGRPGQCGAPDPGGRGLSLRQLLQGGGQSRYRPAVSGRPAYGARIAA